MARVFVSHAGQDVDLAGEVFGWLINDGHELFFDRDLRTGLAAGEPWEPRLLERLRWADAVVCLVTSAYLASVWCTAEVTTAIHRGSRVLPVEAAPGLTHPLLTGIQHVDCTHGRALVRAALGEALRRVDAAGGLGWLDGRSPFPGLQAFDMDMHRVFFGRRAEVNRLAAALRPPADPTDRAVVVVTGPSGCGKSSLVRAGLLPMMADELGWWTLPAMLPGPDPVGALAREITAGARRLGMPWELPRVRSRLGECETTGLVDELLLATPGFGQGRRLLMVIDQLEELLTLTPDAARARFAKVLENAVQGPVQVVATLRPDFLAPLLASPELTGVPIRAFTLRPLTSEALPLVISGPAELAGIGVDPELVTRLVTDTGTGEALPLLAFTLQQLADDVPRGGHLSLSRYELLGGVQGALTEQAEAALAAAMTATGRTSEQVIHGLLRLVSVDAQGNPTRIRVPVEDLPDVVRTELNAFTTRRLLTTDTDNNTVVMGVAHEAFLTAWAPLAKAIADHGTALRTRRAVELTATEWDTTGRVSIKLWERGQLAAALNDLEGPTQRDNQHPPAQLRSSTGRSTHPVWRKWGVRRRYAPGTVVDLSPRAHDFLIASVRADWRRRTRVTTILTVLLVIAVGTACWAVLLQQSAKEQQTAATARELIAQADAIATADPRTAESLALAAHELDPGQQTDAALFRHLVGSQIEASLTSAPDAFFTSAVQAFSPDGHTLATGNADGAVILWDVTDPTRPTPIGQPLAGPAQLVTSVAFSPDLHTLATGCNDGTIILWDVTDPIRPAIEQSLTGHAGSVTSLLFSPDRHTLASGNNDGTVILWNVTDPTRPTMFSGNPAATSHSFRSAASVAFGPDGHTLATGSGTVILWNVTDPTRPTMFDQPLTGQGSSAWSVALSPDRHILAGSNGSGTVILWDVTNPARPTPIGHPLTAHTSVGMSTLGVSFSPDGHTLASGSNDGTVILWNVTDPTRPAIEQSLTGHTSSVTSVAFTPDRHTLATGSNDGTVILWNVTDPTRPTPIGQPLRHTNSVASVAFTPNGHTLAGGSNDGTVILWNVTDPTRPTIEQSLTGHTDSFQFGQPLTGHTDSFQPLSVAFSPDGHTLATASGTVTLSDVTDPTRATPIGQPLTGQVSGVWSVAFAPVGHTLATGNVSGTLILWNVTDPTRPTMFGQPLTGQVSGVWSVAFAPDGHTLATGDAPGTLTLWDVTDPSRPTVLGQPLTGHTDSMTSVAFSPDGRTLATGNGDRTVILSDVTDPTRPIPIGRPLTGHTDSVTSVAFSPDGHTLASGSNDGTVILSDVTDPTRPTPIGQPLTGHTNSVTSVAFSPDGHTLASGSWDQTIIQWNLKGIADLRDHLHERACRTSGNGLSREEWARYVPDMPYRDACAK